MFTLKDVQSRSVFVINCIENRALKLTQGVLLLEDTESNKTLTKLPFQKILTLFVIGNITITTPLIDKCTKYGIPIVVMKPNLRPVFFYSITAEANYLLRQKQFEYKPENYQIAKILVANKVKNQLKLLENTRKKDAVITAAKHNLAEVISLLSDAESCETILSLEGRSAKCFFAAYFEEAGWNGRYPRVKTDPINTTLDIGYTILFNYIEAFIRLFGFDPYIGVYHRLWFRRKSLVCDLMEPFRCIIDRQVRKAFNTKQCSIDDFALIKNEYILKKDKNIHYTKMFYEVLIVEKASVFRYIRDYYRCFMQCKSVPVYPQYLIK